MHMVLKKEMKALEKREREERGEGEGGGGGEREGGIPSVCLSMKEGLVFYLFLFFFFFSF